MTKSEYKLPSSDEMIRLFSELKLEKPDFISKLEERGSVHSSSDLSGWETTLTDPAQHTEQQFRYLVHGV